ncbi:olfactory receptor 8I2-like [Pundamilia nyererei]|uniref:Olfactory receptor 8I2-like n=1 Tax=Pundamilia nyererei TaxID=303518 RepID=A0A9Y6JHP1_9CICH|nr:PREDICTED: olfactory receptor 8I2-like [Pundamilia nyererei]
MSLPNASIKVTHFIIGGFDTVKRPIAVGVVMLITYLLAVIANMLNIILIIFDKRLHKPMYILICNLAVVDILYCCSTTPTMIGVLLYHSYLTNTRTLVVTYILWVVASGFVAVMPVTAATLPYCTSRMKYAFCDYAAVIRTTCVDPNYYFNLVSVMIVGVVLTLEERQGLLIGTILSPSLVNPVVYCFRTKEIKNKIFKIFTKKADILN